MTRLVLVVAVVLGVASFASAQNPYYRAYQAPYIQPVAPVYIAPPMYSVQGPGYTFTTGAGYSSYSSPGWSWSNYSPYAAAAQYNAIWYGSRGTAVCCAAVLSAVTETETSREGERS